MESTEPDSTSQHYTVRLQNRKNLYFLPCENNPSHYELWCTDESPQATTLLRVIESCNTYPTYLSIIDEAFYFVADDSDQWGLWKSDGTSTGTILLKRSYPHYVFVMGDTLYFRTDDALHGNTLWKTNGTLESTMRAFA